MAARPTVTSRPGSPEIADLLDAIYDTALDPSGWDDAVALIGEMFPAVKVALQVFDGRLMRVPVMVAANIPTDAVEAYTAHYSAVNPTLRRMQAIPEGVVCDLESVLPLGELVGTEFYEDWMVPLGDIRAGVGSNVVADRDRILALIMMIGADDLGAHAKCLEVAQAIVPHMSRAFRLARRLAEAEAASADEDHAAIADRLALPMFILDASRRVVHMNAAAEGAAAGFRGVMVDRRDRLLAHPTVQDALDAALSSCLGDGVPPPPLPLPSDRGDVYAVAFRLRGRRESLLTASLPGRERIALMLLDSTLRERPCEELLREAFALSPAEATLAQVLAEGGDLVTYAERRCVTLNTARSQLKTLMRKVGASRQSELVSAIQTHPLIVSARLFNR